MTPVGKELSNDLEVLANIHYSLEDGLRSGILNRRGVTSRGLEEGGAQERSLVAKCRTDADALADQWPRTAAILRSASESYEAEGHRNEDSA